MKDINYEAVLKKRSKALIVIFSICTVILLIYLPSIIIKSLKSYVEKDTKYVSNSIKEIVDDKLDILHIIDGFIKIDGELNIDDYAQKLKENVDTDMFSNIYVSDKKGNVKSIKGQYANIYRYTYFKEAMEGNANVSTTGISSITNEKILVFAIPIKYKNEVVGVLCARNTIDEFRDTLLETISSNMNLYIVSKDSNEIIATFNNNISKANKVVSSIGEFIKDNDVKEKEFKIINSDKNIRVFKYDKLVKLSDWYVITDIPIKNIILNNKSITIIITIILLIILISKILKDSRLLKIKKENQIKLEKAAYLDKLTNLKNINKIIIDGNKILKNNKGNMLAISCDIQRFNVMKEIYGYKYADNILIRVSQVLNENSMNASLYGIISRESLFILCEIKDLKKDVEDKISILQKEVENITINNQNLNLNLKLSIGAYIVHHTDKDMNKVIHYSDLARKKSKMLNQASYYIYDENLAKEREEEVLIEKKMKLGLESNKFKIYYQAKYDVDQEKIVGAEALIRWFDDELGFVSPLKFIGIAEKNGYINLIGKWVLEQVCKDIKEWEEQGLEIVPISINISRVELYQEFFVENIKTTIEKYSINPKYIEIEITETTALNDLNFINKKITEIRELGILISMDDFGTGNSNLSNLKLINIDILKIDRSLLIDIDTNEKSRYIVEMIVNLCMNLGHQIVCEGIEKVEQVNTLKKMKCSVIQGYLFYKPIPEDEFKKLLKKI